jgi:putative MATE family efflux protein
MDFFAILIGLISGAAGIIFSRWAYVKFVAVPPEILDSTLLYYRIYCAGLIFQFAYNSLASILRSVGDSAATLYFLLLASVLNIALDLWFVAVLDWGVAGAAAATNIAQAFSVIAAWIYMQKKYPVFRYKIQELTWKNSIAVTSFKLGWPIAMQLMIVAVGITFIQRAVNSFGQVMTATFTVGQRIEMYLHLPCNAMMTTLATYTGQNVGANKMDRVKQGAAQGVMISFGLTALLSLIVYFCADKLPGLFALGKEASEYSQEYLKSISFVVVILSLYVPLFGVFQGTRHVMVPTVVALCALTLRVIVTFVFKDDPDCFGHTIIWWNGLFGFSTGCIMAYSYYFSGRWRSNALVK